MKLAKEIADIAKGKIKLGGIKVPKQVVPKPVKKVAVKKKIVKKVIRVVKHIIANAAKMSAERKRRILWRFKALEQRSEARAARKYVVKRRSSWKHYLKKPKKAGFLGASTHMSCGACVKRFEAHGGCSLLQSGGDLSKSLSDQCLRCGTAASLHCANKMFSFSTDATDVTKSAKGGDSWLKGFNANATPLF